MKLNKDRIRIFFIVYMVIIYVIDVVSTYLAISGGGFEINPILKFFISLPNGFLMISAFFFMLIFAYILVSEIMCFFLGKVYNKDIVFVSVYTSVIATFSIIQISNIIGNLYIWIF